MATAEIKATARPNSGKGAARQARREGQVPGVIYGDGKEPTTISVDARDLGKTIAKGKSADVAFEAVGIPATFDICQAIVAPGGRIANVGVHGQPVQLRAAHFLRRRLRHRFAASLIWDLPFWRGATSADFDDAAFWLGGWQLATLAQGATGQPFTLNVPFDSNLDGNLTDRPLTTDNIFAIQDEIAKAILFLASDDASYFTGQWLSPNGGLVIGG